MLVKNFIKKQMTVKKLSKIIKTKNICLCLGFFAYVSAYSQPFGGGSGTQQDPYQISDLSHLLLLNDSVMNYNSIFQNKHFILINDILDSLRHPIGRGDGSGNIRVFRNNTFDGQGYSINLAIDTTGPQSGSQGLFALVENSTIKNLTVNGYIKANSAGGIVGEARANTHIINCISNVHMICMGICGGIIYFARYNTIIENTINLGTIEPNYANFPNNVIFFGFGGIAGRATNNVRISNSANYGLIVADSNAAGIVGNTQSTAFENLIISNNFNSGVVRSGVIHGKNIGCIVGKNQGGTLLNNHYDKQMCGEED